MPSLCSRCLCLPIFPLGSGPGSLSKSQKRPPLSESLAVSVHETGHSNDGGTQSEGNIPLNYRGSVDVSQNLCRIRLN